MTICNYVHLKDSSFLSISGEDANEFIQSLITNDIYKCLSGKSIYACLLTPQGKFLSDFFIFNKSSKYIFEINNIFFEDFINKINLYKLRSKIDINIIKNLTSLVVLNKNIQFKDNIKFIKFNDTRNYELGIKIFIDLKLINIFIHKNNLTEISLNNYRKLLINYNIPYSPLDLKINKSLLLENNFDKINAIDWEKGCYVGQEITARMKYRALLKKSLRSFIIIKGEVKIGDEIYYLENIIGEIISFVQNSGLMMVKIRETDEAKLNNTVLSTVNSSIKIIN